MPRNERQIHGFTFEDWLKKTFFDIYYTSEWDISKKLNPNPVGGPISIKTAKWRGSVYFGDATRQFQINQPFTLIVGFWKSEANKKKIAKIVESVVSPDKWKEIWKPLTAETIRELDILIKDRSVSPEIARNRIQEKLLTLRNKKPTIITLNPKIDSKTQRRLQCSLSFANFFRYLVGVDPDTVEEDTVFSLWGENLTPPHF